MLSRQKVCGALSKGLKPATETKYRHPCISYQSYPLTSCLLLAHRKYIFEHPLGKCHLALSDRIDRQPSRLPSAAPGIAQICPVLSRRIVYCPCFVHRKQQEQCRYCNLHMSPTRTGSQAKPKRCPHASSGAAALDPAPRRTSRHSRISPGLDRRVISAVCWEHDHAQPATASERSVGHGARERRRRHRPRSRSAGLVAAPSRRRRPA